MNRALVGRLVLKDWYMSRLPLTWIAVGGALSVVLASQPNELGFAGIISALIAIIMLSNLIPGVTIVNERKHQNLAFVMSLPISPMEYTTSKVLGNLTAFVVLWIAIAGMVLGTIAWSDAPDGFIPFGVIVALMPAVVFCVLLCVAIVSESEFWTMVMTAGSNVIYSFWWFLFNRVPGLRDDLGSPVPVWSDAILTIIGVQLAVCVVAIALTFILQARKRSFI